MKLLLAGVVAVVGFVGLAVAITTEGAFAVTFGWIPFLLRVVPQVKPDAASVVVGSLALLLFAVGIHWLGRSSRGSNPESRWRIRWTVATVFGVLLLFTAGISIVGITHQVAWLSTSDQPLTGQGLRRGSGSTENRLRMISMGTQTYHGVFGVLPPGTFTDKGEMLHSWETHTLPFMVTSTAGIDMSRPWNSPGNDVYFRSVLPDFINPGYRAPALEDADGFGLSHYAANSRIIMANRSLTLAEITNGTSNTILLGEVNAGFKPWGQPINWRDPAAGLNRGPTTFGGPPNTGVTTFAMADGSVRAVSNSVDLDVLRAMSNSNAEQK